MPITARRFLSRLSNMSWDELETRLRQEVSKRIDVAMCQVGLQPGRNGLNLTPTQQGQFFFSPSDIPHRTSLIRQHLPLRAEQIVRDAKDLCHHRFRLLGYKDVSYATEIDWHLDAVHGLRSPMIPWFKINFLDFSQVGDHKITWELNRHQHLVTLAKAWLLTGEKAYADEIFAQWDSWHRANPYPLGANWASSLEVAFRSLSWIWVDRFLTGCPYVPPNFRSDLIHGLALNGWHIDRYISTYFSPNTHLLGEAVVLFFIGTLYPQIPSASRWRNQGWKIVQEEAVRQVRPDGIYFEQTLYYHVYALDFLLYARLLAARNGVEIPVDFDHVIRKMLNFVNAVSEVGPPDGFGDDDGGRVFDSSRNRAEHMTDPLAIGAALFSDARLRSSLTEESIWLLGDAAISAANRAIQSHAPQSQAFHDGGVYLIATSEPFAQQMAIDAGPQGTGHCGHGHADSLSVRFAFGGRRWLVDAGTCWYIGPGNDRNVFRGTRAHNTMSVDGLDQAQSAGPFAWSSIPKTQVESFVVAPNFSFFIGSHSGYERLPEPVRHRRVVFQHRNLWLIRDLADGSGSHTLETSWHFASDLTISKLGNAFIAATTPDQQNRTHLALLPVEDAQWASELLTEAVSPAYGGKIDAPVVRVTSRSNLPAEHATLLIPMVGERSQPFGTLTRCPRHDGPENPAAVYRYHDGRFTDYFAFGPEKSAWTFGLWSSDAAFLYFRVEDRHLSRILMCGGSVIRYGGNPVICHDRPIQWFEWGKEARQSACSDDNALRSFQAQPLEVEFAI